MCILSQNVEIKLLLIGTTPKVKKPLDKGSRKRYTDKADSRGGQNRKEKFQKEILKKVLTNRKECDIIKHASSRNEESKTKKELRSNSWSQAFTLDLES